MRLLSVLLLLVLAACSSPAPDGAVPVEVTSHLSGRVAIADTLGLSLSDVDLLVLNNANGSIDTLALISLSADSTFAADVRAPDRGVYPLIVRVRGETAQITDLVVTDGDSATAQARVPADRRMRIRSRENDGWMAYRNTRAQFDAQLAEAREELQQGADASQVEQRIGQAAVQAASILWSLREGFAGTVGAELASAEAVAMLEGVDDAQALDRAQAIEPGNVAYATVARAARRSAARTGGQASAIALLERMRDASERSADAAAIQAEIVTARLDSLQKDEALAAADALKRDYSSDEWGAWATRASYEASNLLPGMRAPAIRTRSARGDAVSLSGLSGRFVVLEFMEPGESAFSAEVPGRAALARLLEPQGVSFVTVSVGADTLLSRAFFDQVPLPGAHVIAKGGLESDIAKAYNVRTTPVRYLIDRTGHLSGKYVGPSLGILQSDLLALLAAPSADEAAL